MVSRNRIYNQNKEGLNQINLYLTGTFTFTSLSAKSKPKLKSETDNYDKRGYLCHFCWTLVCCKKKLPKYLSGRSTSWFWLQDHNEGRWLNSFSKTIVIEVDLVTFWCSMFKALVCIDFWCRPYVHVFNYYHLKTITVL